MIEEFSYEKWLFKKIEQRLSYNPYTGLFIWKDGKNAGRVAGVQKNVNSYVTITVTINKVNHTILANRLAWYFYYGRLPLPGLVIDHMDNVKSNNRIANLQEITHQYNIQRAKDVYLCKATMNTIR